MAEWKISGLQIIVSVISSGLIVTVFGILINNIIKPDLQFDLNAESMSYAACDQAYREILNISECGDEYYYRLLSDSFDSPIYNYSILENILENRGLGTANNLRLTLYYPDAEIIHNHTNYSTENITSLKNENSHVLSVNIPRLAQGGKISVTTVIEGDHIRSNNLKDKFYTPTEVVFYDFGRNIFMATYDQGSKSYLPEDEDALFRVSLNPYKIPIFLIAVIVAIISIPITLRHKTIRSSKDSKKPARFVYDIYENIAKVRDILNKDLQSTKIFTPAIWDSKGYEDRRQIFDTYNDYKRLDQFYDEIRRRNSYFSHYYLVTNNNLHSLKQQNAKCLDLANDCYTNINWGRFFYSKNKKKLDIILSIPLILLSSILLFFVCEGSIFYIFYVSSPNVGEILELAGETPLVLFLLSSSIARGIAISLIIREILKRFEAFDADYSGINNGISTYSTISKRNKIKLFVYSIFIIGMPAISLIILFDIIKVYYPSLDYIYNYVLYNTYGNAILFVLDIARLIILMYVVIPKFIANGQKIDTMLTIRSD